MRALVDLLKKVPIDLGQGAVAEYTEGKQIAKRLTPDGASRTALDLGARYGAQSRWLEARGYEVTSVDIEPKFDECLHLDANVPYH